MRFRANEAGLSPRGLCCCPLQGGYSDAEHFGCNTSIVVIRCTAVHFVYLFIYLFIYSCGLASIVVIFNGSPLCFLPLREPIFFMHFCIKSVNGISGEVG